MATQTSLTELIKSTTENPKLMNWLYQGDVRSQMRVDGELSADIPPGLRNTLDSDLARCGFGMLRAGLNLRELGGDYQVSREAFDFAGKAFEYLIKNANPDNPELSFLRIMAASSYHLAGFSAIAFSLLSIESSDKNLTPSEFAIRLLILRQLDKLNEFLKEWLLKNENNDEFIADYIEKQETIDYDTIYAQIINVSICRSLACFEFALQTGEIEHIFQAKNILLKSTKLCESAGIVTLWWMCKLCIHFIDDLWMNSLHMILPEDFSESESDRFDHRKIFIGSLYKRIKPQIEVWPSQIEAIRRSADPNDDLVVTLPTSAGKTRIAEVAALATLKSSGRVLIVTPLRALSAQTERIFLETFSPLDFSVSSLYGSKSISALDMDSLRKHDIVISTPEKLDFALKHDSSLIQEFKLVILDEGHMIGSEEREIRYEVLVQKLLKLPNSSDRRIVCLSAILPSGEELQDFASWIRSDKEGSPIESDWRPTRQRFGTLIWSGKSAKLTLDTKSEYPFINRFIVGKPNVENNEVLYPKNRTQLTLLAAWKFAKQEKSVLIFSTQANWINGFVKQIVKLNQKGFLESLLTDQSVISDALKVGMDWLPEDDLVLECLRLGVAVHYGGLPSPYLRELEKVLSRADIKVIIASPTLSQGLNLNASILLIPYLIRSKKTISGKELANVAGRAGRAYVDVEGTIIHVIHGSENWRRNKWYELVKQVDSRNIVSGLIQIVAEIINRFGQTGVSDREDVWEYIANSTEAWKLLLSIDNPNNRNPTKLGDYSGISGFNLSFKEKSTAELVENLDVSILNLIENLEADKSELDKLLDLAFAGSIWMRQLDRINEDTKDVQLSLIYARTQHIWLTTNVDSRRGYYAMGVGLYSGQDLDLNFEELCKLVDIADKSTLSGDTDALVQSLIELTRILFEIGPFKPAKKMEKFKISWEKILEYWVSGKSALKIGQKHMEFVEDALIYKMAWALEAINLKRSSEGWSPDYIIGGAAASLETGVPQFQMSMLVRAGLSSREASILAIQGSNASFLEPKELLNWLNSEEIVNLTNGGNWPSSETSDVWKQFHENTLAKSIKSKPWIVDEYEEEGFTLEDSNIAEGTYRLIENERTGETEIFSADFEKVGELIVPIDLDNSSIHYGKFTRDFDDEDEIEFYVHRIGPELR